MKKIIGISGFIGSGKTEAGRFFEELGADFIEADSVVDDLYRMDGEGRRKIQIFFGDTFLRKDGEVDRRKLARFVFGDPHKLQILNNLIHPLVTNEVQKRIDASNANMILVEALYFLPTGIGRLVDAIIWIECEKDVLKQRVLKRPEVDEPLFEKILKTQGQPAEIDYVIPNNDDMASFHRELKKVWDSLR